MMTVAVRVVMTLIMQTMRLTMVVVLQTGKMMMMVLQAVRMMMVVVVLFCICWLPYHLYFLLEQHFPINDYKYINVIFIVSTSCSFRLSRLS
jgi:hypothetical protein